MQMVAGVAYNGAAFVTALFVCVIVLFCHRCVYFAYKHKFAQSRLYLYKRIGLNHVNTCESPS